MQDTLDTLTDEQAFRAIRLFYDFMPSDSWENGQKPSPERVRTLGEVAKDGLPPHLKSLVSSILAPENPCACAAQAQICRIVLRRAHSSKTWAPIVNKAVESAKQPKMAIDPLTGAFILALLIATSDVEVTKNKIKVRGAKNMADIIKALSPAKILKELPGALKSLPKELLAALGFTQDGID